MEGGRETAQPAEEGNSDSETLGGHQLAAFPGLPPAPTQVAGHCNEHWVVNGTEPCSSREGGDLPKTLRAWGLYWH